MKITYKVLNNQSAVLLTRQAQLAQGNIPVVFQGASTKATAIFESGETVLYRPLDKDCTCSIPANKLHETVRVTLAILDEITPTAKWRCEELKVTRHKNGAVWITPNDMNLPQEVVEIRMELAFLREVCADLVLKNQQLEERLANIMEGYDLV